MRMGKNGKTGASAIARRTLRRFSRSQRGVTAVEFAFVGPVFFAIIGATIETALAFFAGYALDAAVIDTSRLIRTGQSGYTSGISSPANYRSAVCGKLYGMFDCDAIRIRVRPLTRFSDFQMSSAPVNAGTGDWQVDNSYVVAGEGGIMMIEAFYKWPTLFNIPGLNAGQTADGKRLLAATHVFRNEPPPIQ